MPNSERTTSPTIGFRVPANVFEHLKERAELVGLSVHEHARMIVLRAVENQDAEQILNDLSNLRDDHSHLRHALAATVEAMFLNLTDIAPKQAKEWARKHILQSSEREVD